MATIVVVVVLPEVVVVGFLAQFSIVTLSGIDFSGTLSLICCFGGGFLKYIVAFF